MIYFTSTNPSIAYWSRLLTGRRKDVSASTLYNNARAQQGYQHKTQSAGGVVLDAQGQILLVQEYGLYWGLPRGHVEPGESFISGCNS